MASQSDNWPYNLIGHHATSIRGIDWEWRKPVPDAVVTAVRCSYGWGGGILVAVTSEEIGKTRWTGLSDVELLSPDEYRQLQLST